MSDYLPPRPLLPCADPSVTAVTHLPVPHRRHPHRADGQHGAGGDAGERGDTSPLGDAYL